MSNRVIDGSSIFTGDDLGKDGLRKEFGVYYEIDEGAVVPKVNSVTPYLFTQGAAATDTSGLLPFNTQRLTFTSASNVDNYDQWAANFRAKFVPNVEYIDHFFNTPLDFTNIDAINNYESYGYELLTKNVPPLSILNIHDQDDFPADTLGPNGAQMQMFLDQFSINRSETTARQNLFFGAEKIKDIKIGHIEQVGLNVPDQPNRPYNSFVKIKPLSSVLYSNNVPTPQEILFDQTKMTNKLFSYFKREVGTGLDFYLDSEETLTQVNVRGFIDFISNYDLLSLVTQPDEKFYKDFEEATSFESQFLRLEMFSRIRDFVSQRMRKTFNSVILQNDSCANLIVGYKIQKFVANGTQPIQTTYIMTPKTRDYYDSLFSYDTMYRYEIKAITMVLGTSYSYSNVQEDPEQGQITLTFVIPLLAQSSNTTSVYGCNHSIGPNLD